MKIAIKPRTVYQILENSNPIKRSPRILPAGVFVEVVNVGDNGYAQCKVLHILKQPKAFPKLKCGQKVFFSLVSLGMPDLFPALRAKPKNWLNAVQNPDPIVDAAQKVVEKIQCKAKVTAAAINTVDGFKKLLKTGQLFKSAKASTIIVETITQQGNVAYKLLDKINLVSVDDFLKLLTDGAYWTSPAMNWRRTSKTIWMVMSPFLGMLGAIFITKLLEKRVLNS